MGLLVKGEWHTDWYQTKSDDPEKDGEFIREDSQFRSSIGKADFPAEAGRYHLFVSLACPWAHRTLIMRSIKQLESVIGVTIVQPEMLDKGWEIDDQVSLDSGYDKSPIEGITTMHQVYTTAQPDYSGRVTVPVLWDKKTQTIVNNESAEILRMLNSAFYEFTPVKTDYYPEALRFEIDQVNEFVYDTINNGVYKVGFATTQPAYERNFHRLFHALDAIEKKLGKQGYLVGSSITEADWRLFTTLIRFDSVYYGHFKTNLKRIEDYPNLSNYVRDLYQQAGVAETVNFDHIKTHYYYSHDTINPTRVVPVGPEIDYNRPHNRNRFKTTTVLSKAS